MRLFIAIDLPQELITYIQQLQLFFKEHLFFEGSYPTAEHMHSTVFFIGETSEESIPNSIHALQAIDIHPFTVRVTGIFVDNAHYPKIVWLTIDAPQLPMIYQILREHLKPSEKGRALLPHITIARIKKMLNRDALLATLDTIKVPEISFTVTALALKNSYIKDDVRYHETVYRYYLQ